MRFVCVLKSGGEYKPPHVRMLQRGVLERLPDAEFFCLTDFPVAGVECLSLRHDWPGWWSKMELFRPDIGGDLLYLDLDTVIVGALDDIAAVRDLTVLADFYWPDKTQSSLMFIPESARAEIWEAFAADPARHMRECTTREAWGDQGFLERFWKHKAALWQDVLPGQIVSYKVHVRRREHPRERGNGLVPPGARVVCYHGRPRPWQTQLRSAA